MEGEDSDDLQKRRDQVFASLEPLLQSMDHIQLINGYQSQIDSSKPKPDSMLVNDFHVDEEKQRERAMSIKMPPEKKEAIIGIGGGVGPAAGVALHSKIIENSITDGTDQSHFEVYHLSRWDLNFKCCLYQAF